MDTNKIKALMTSLESGSLLKASEILGYTSSGLTHMMNSLEEEFQIPLLKRSSSGVRATPECQRILPYLNKIIKDESDLINELSLIRLKKTKIIRLAMFSSTSRNMVPQIIKDYSTKHNDVTFQVLVGGKEEIRHWLINGDADAAICSEIAGDKFNFYPFKRDEYFAVVPKDSRFSNLKSLTFYDLKDKTFIISTYGTDYNFQKDMVQLGLVPQKREMPIDDPAIVAMVSCGLGIGILSALMFEGCDSDVKLIPLNPKVDRILGMCTYGREKLDPYLKELLSLSYKLFDTDQEFK